MSGISFTIHNTAVNKTKLGIERISAVLYLEQANTLDFAFSSEDFSAMTPGDQVFIVIPDTLLASADAAQLGSADWLVVSITQPSDTDNNFTYLLTPKTTVPFIDNILTITLTGLKGNTVTNDNVSTRFLISIGGKQKPLSGGSQKLFVQLPPGNGKDLYEDLSIQTFINPTDPATNPNGMVPRGTVYVSSQTLTPPIANRIHLNLKYNGDNIKSWPSKTPPTFIFSFSTGSASDDLTNDLTEHQEGYNPLTTAWEIEGSIESDETDLWEIAKAQNISDDHHISPIWKVTPKSDRFFSDSPNLDVLFDHVISVLPPGNATLYVQWSNIPGYNGGVKLVDLLKGVPTPLVLSFGILNDQGNLVESLNTDLPARLQWSTFAAKTVDINWNDGGPQTQHLPVSTDNPSLIYTDQANPAIASKVLQTNFFIMAKDAGGNQSQPEAQVTVNKIPVVNSFSAVMDWDAEGAFLTFEWDTQYAQSCAIRGIATGLGPSSDPGSPLNPRLSKGNCLQTTYTLHAVGAGGLETDLTLEASLFLEKSIRLGPSTDFSNIFRALAISPDGKTIFASNANDVYTIDTLNPPDIASQIPYQQQPGIPIAPYSLLTVLPHGDWAYFDQWASPGAQLLSFNTKNLQNLVLGPTVTAGQTGDALFNFGNLVATPDNQVFAINLAEKSLYGFDGVKPLAAAQKIITGGVSGVAVAATANVSRVFVLNYDAKSISWFDTKNTTNIFSIPLPGNPTQITTSPDGKKVVVTLFMNFQYSLYIFDAENPPPNSSPTIYTVNIAALQFGFQAIILPSGSVLLFSESNRSTGIYLLDDLAQVSDKSLQPQIMNLYPKEDTYAIKPDGTRVFIGINNFFSNNNDAQVYVLSFKFAPKA